MEIKTFGDMTTLKGYIDSDAVPTYFASSEIVDSTLKCYVGENVAVEITNTTVKTYYDSGQSSHTVTSSVQLNSICVTDNSIILYSSNYAPSVVICKNDSDDTVVLYFASYNNFLQNQSDISSFNSSVTIRRLFIITCMKSMLIKGSGVQRGDAYTELDCDSIFNADGIVKNVWLSFYTPFPSHITPFRYTIDSVGYVGTGYNDFVIKST